MIIVYLIYLAFSVLCYYILLHYKQRKYVLIYIPIYFLIWYFYFDGVYSLYLQLNKKHYVHLDFGHAGESLIIIGLACLITSIIFIIILLFKVRPR